MTVRETNLWVFVVNLLPKRLIEQCAYHVVAYATTGKYSSTVVPELSAMDALKRYGDDHNL